MPCDGSARFRTGGYPPSSGLGPHAMGAHGPSLALPDLRAVCAICWGGGGPVLFLGPVPRGGPVLLHSGVTPRAPAARRGRARSLGVLIPPNGEGSPSLPLGPSLISSPALAPSLGLAAGGGLLRYWGLPPISCIRPRTKGVHACLGGAPPLSFGLESAPPLSSPYLHAMLWERTLLGGGPFGPQWGPGFSPVPACRALGAHAARGCPLLLSLLTWGVPFLLLGHAMR